MTRVRDALEKAKEAYKDRADAVRYETSQNPFMRNWKRAAHIRGMAKSEFVEAADSIERPGLGAQLAARFRTEALIDAAKEMDDTERAEKEIRFIERHVVAPHLSGVTFLGTFKRGEWIDRR